MRKLLTKLFYKLGYQKEMLYGRDYNYVMFVDDREGNDEKVPKSLCEVGIVINRGIFKSLFFTFDVNKLMKKGEMLVDIHDGNDIITYWGKFGEDQFNKQISSITKNIIDRNTKG